jgi:Serine dehydratase beta chain
MAVSVFDLFKIGIGPSSSHTVGPMRAARLFALRLESAGVLGATTRVRTELYGSLGATGKGHGSDKAVLLGLAGHEPDTVNVEDVPALLAGIRDTGRVNLLARRDIAFDEKSDLIFNRRESLPLHSNGMKFTASDAAGAVLAEHVYYSSSAAMPDRRASLPMRRCCHIRSPPANSCSRSARANTRASPASCGATNVSGAGMPRSTPVSRVSGA